MNEKIIIQLFVLDDDEVIRMIIQDALENADIGPFKMFEDHETFMEEFDKNVNIAIIDYRLAGPLTGLEVMDLMKKVNPFCQVIIITGLNETRVWDECIEAGVRSVIYKGEDRHVFLGKLLVAVHKAYRLLDSLIARISDDIKKLNGIKFNSDVKPRMG